MTWHQRDRYYMESSCGRFTVSRMRVAGGWLYTGWHRASRGAVALHTGTKDACIRACERAAHAIETAHGND